MAAEVEFCAILTIRYKNPLLMGSAHDWVSENQPAEMPKGCKKMRSFHIAPDRGMTIIWFDTKDNLEAAFPFLKSFQNELATRFEAYCNSEKAITSPDLDVG